MAAKILGNSGVLYTDRRDFYISPQVVKELWTDVSPFTTVLSNRETRSGLADPQYKMFEHRNPWQKQQFVCNENMVSLAAGDTASDPMDIKTISGLVDPADSSYIGYQCEVWDTTLATKRGVVLITAVDAGGAVSFKNMGDAAVDIDSNDVLIVVGNAHGEGTEAPEAWADEISVVYNQAQIFKTPVEVTGTLYAAALRGESNELARLRTQKSQEHKVQKERAFLFGRSPINLTGTGTFNDSSLTDANGKIVRSTMGIIPAIEKHGASSGDDQSIFAITKSSYDYGSFVDDMEKVFQYVPEAGSKRAFCGGGALSYWSKLGGSGSFSDSSGWTVNIGDMKRDSLGFNYRTLETPHGNLQLIPTPVMRGPYSEKMLVVSDENLFLAQYRAPKYQANIKTDNAYDGVKDQYMSDEGIGVSLIESHKLFSMS